ncbi:basic protein bp2 [Halobacterium salinarum R1]|uniref:Basic protein bp2 n=3 Tax=Halobacterium salinarum TaxID=2242 RepID=A0A510N776_HALSA|nr:basic protein bp2 [Halobacterium salinarum]CCM80489.1 basic protein bp2 [Halobacterium salinarum R1]DAC78511.1 TPA_inf: basic protein bp2 [Halobacterium salinarum NRC-1]
MYVTPALASPARAAPFARRGWPNIKIPTGKWRH